MPLDALSTPIAQRVAGLNSRFGRSSAEVVLGHALTDPTIGRIALVSSFGAESVVLLHMISRIDRNLPVLFLETEMLFPETLVYQNELADSLGLTNVQVIRPDSDAKSARDPDGRLHLHDPDACCTLRKTEPLQRALGGYDAWITGRKQYQGQTRLDLELFEHEASQRIKINPLVKWTSRDVQDYIAKNQLPRHPLVASGFASIGCQPCTTRVAAGEPERAGRWRGGPKVECGIHFDERVPVRGDLAA